jgi:hypothetical protein
MHQADLFILQFISFGVSSSTVQDFDFITDVQMQNSAE